MNYEIVPIDPTVAYIVTIDDEPLRNADGHTIKFYREVDAQRSLDHQRDDNERRATPRPRGPSGPNPGIRAPDRTERVKRWERWFV